MDTQETDKKLRDLYEQNAAPVDMGQFSHRLYSRLSPLRPRRGGRHWRRAIGLAFVGLVVVAALGVGIFEAATHLGTHRTIIVIGDETTTSVSVPTVGLTSADYDWRTLTVPLLVKDADIIIRGRVSEEPSARWNSADGKQWAPKNSSLRSPSQSPQFYTTWMVTAEDVLKGQGQVQAGDVVPFRFVGGTVVFNGRLAHYVGYAYPELRAGDELIVFGTLKSLIGGTFTPPGLWLMGGGLSVFRQTGSDFVRVIKGGGPADTDRTTPEQIKALLAVSSVTTSGTAPTQTNSSASSSGATTTVSTYQEVKMKWGETATAGGGTVKVETPIADPQATPWTLGFRVLHCLVTITNTGKTPLTYSPSDFSIEGRSSGSGGLSADPATTGQPALVRRTLAPGQTVKGAVKFELHQEDAPVLVSLIVPWSNRIHVTWR